MSPSANTNSNNPFLSDLSQEDASEESHDTRSHAQQGSNKHLTASEEKEALRRRYMQVDNEDIPAPRNSGRDAAELPPSYDEIAGARNRKKGYPKEKAGETRSHHDRERRSGDRDRERERRVHRAESGAGNHSRRHRKSSNGKKSGSSPERKSSTKGPLPKNVDTIDKLDVTGLFGGAFHHDGPFDACTPHRNKNTKAAPVMAFPADGPNSSIAGPAAGKSAIKEVFGHTEVDDDDYLYKPKGTNGVNISSSTVDAIKPNSKNITQFDPKMKELVHGPTTAGLGSTTFLDGAPAAASVIRDESGSRDQGIQRKKSLSQRLKVSTAKNDDVRLRKVSSDSTPNSPSIFENNGTFDNARKVDNYNNDDEDYYLGGNSTGVRFNSSSKKESTGNKFLRRVKSLKVSRK